MSYVMTAKLAGQEVSSTYEGRHVDVLESTIVHPTHPDTFVDKGDPVIMGEVVGVAFRSAVAATEIIAIDTEGIWALSVVAVDQNGNSPVAVGDEIFISRTTGVLSKISTIATNAHFGWALSILATGTTGIVAVKVHTGVRFIPEITNIVQTFTRAQMTDNHPGATGHIDLTVPLPIGAVPLGWKALCNLGFTGDTSAIVQVGISGDLDRFSADVSGSVFATNALIASLVIAADGGKSIAAATAIRVTITSAADFTNVAAGNLTITFFYLMT